MNQLCMHYVSGPFVMLVEIVKQHLIVFFLSPSLSLQKCRILSSGSLQSMRVVTSLSQP